MNYFKLIVVGIVCFILFIGDIHVGEAKGKSRRFAVDAASVNGPTPVLPIFLYGQDGPSVLNENAQQFVNVHYRYGKNVKLSGAEGKGSFKIDDGLGNISKGVIKQDYKIIGGQAKVAKNNIDMDTKYLDGSKSKQNISVYYSYDNNGKLQFTGGSGKLISNDGFENKTEGKISQSYLIIKGQPKLKNSTQDFKTTNVDGSGQNKNLTITYNYDKTGKLRTASGRGTVISDDGFGNTIEGTIAQNYQVINSQAKRVASKESMQPAGGKSRRFAEDPASINPLPPPPPPSQMAKEKPAVLPQPALTPRSEEPEQKWAAPEESEGAEEIAVEKKQEPELAERPPAPQEEATALHCERGTWSPTFGRCIEEEAPSESLQRACETGTHWSPTLKSCQSD